MVLLPCAAYAGDTYCGNPKSQRAVLVIHGGSFGIGSPQLTEDSCKAFGRAGYYAINSDYPLGDLRATEKHLRAQVSEARLRHKKVFAYGESAGGGLAALLSARSLVDAAFACSPVSDLNRWQAESKAGFVNWKAFKESDQATLRQASAAHWASKTSTPLMVVHGRNDTLVPLGQSLRLRKRYPAMTLKIVRGGHPADETSFVQFTRTALAWLKRQ